MARAGASFSILLVALAGCLAAPAETVRPTDALPPGPFVPPVPAFDFTTVVDPDHGAHGLPALHDVGHGLALAGFTPIQDALPPTVRGSITQVDVSGDHAVVSGMEGGLAFALVDIADPATPKVVSWWPSAANGWTARFSDDGAYVFYGCQVLASQYTVATQVTGAQLFGRCEDPSKPDPTRKGGVVAVDVTDKADPKFVAFTPTDRAHNLYTVAIDGVDWVFTDGVEVLRFDREAATLDVVAKVPGRHDATVQKHPVTGQWLLYTGTEQLAIYDVDDPASPEPVYEGGVEGPDGAKAVAWHEQTLVPGLVDGRYVLVGAGETFDPVRGSRSTGVVDVLSFIDVTDPTAPTFLGEWRAPWQPKLPWATYAYSVHEMAATPSGQVAVAWYHGGVWVVDVSTKERQAEPVTLAAYQPNMPITATPSTFVQTPVPMVPFVWGVGWDDRGHLVVPDMHTGLYVLEPEWGLVPAVDSGQ